MFRVALDGLLIPVMAVGVGYIARRILKVKKDRHIDHMRQLEQELKEMDEINDRIEHGGRGQ